MKNIWTWIKKNPNRTMFLVPIILVAGISISHVVAWYDIANPISWAIYLSIAIEVGAMTALVAAMNKIKGGVWFMFGLVTFVQMIGNIFFSFKEVDPQSYLFKSWIELTGPVWESIGSDINDVTAMKRWLAFLEGGLLPIISLTSLHFFIKYDDGNGNKIKMFDNSDTTSNEKLNETITEKSESVNINKVENNSELIEKPKKSETETVSSFHKSINDEHEHSTNSLNYNANRENIITNNDEVKENSKLSNINDSKSFENKSHSTERNIDFDGQIISDSTTEVTPKPTPDPIIESKTKITPEPTPKPNIEVKTEVTPEPTYKQVTGVTPVPKVEAITESLLEITAEPTIQVKTEVTPEPKPEIPYVNGSIEKNIPDFVTDTNQNEEKTENFYEVEYIEIPQTDDILEIPISGNFEPERTVGKKLSYKRTS